MSFFAADFETQENMAPRRTIAAFVLACCWAAAAYAQIKIGAEYDHDTPIVAECGQPPLLGGEAEYRWLIDGAEAGLIPVDSGKSVHIWRAAGEHTLTLDVTYTISIVQPDPSAPDDRTKDKPVKLTLPAYHYAATFRVLPDGGPAPTPQSLAELAGADAKDIGAVLAALAAQVSTDSSLTVAQAQAAATSLLARWPGNKAVPVIEKRLAVDTLPAFLAALDGVVKELGGPGPAPTPAPIPVAGLHVLIVEETGDRSRVSPGQLSVLQTTQIAAAVKAAGGQFRQYDEDQPLADPVWQAALSRPRAAVPWIVVSNGEKGGTEQPLPASIEETLALIRRYE